MEEVDVEPAVTVSKFMTLFLSFPPSDFHCSILAKRHFRMTNFSKFAQVMQKERVKSQLQLSHTFVDSL